MKSYEALAQPVSSLAGIGPRTTLLLNKLGLVRIQDLLFHLPNRYLDKTRAYPIQALTAGQYFLTRGIVDQCQLVGRQRKSLVCHITDSTGMLSLRFFHYQAQMLDRLKPGTLIACFGDVKEGFNGLEMIHPEYHFVSEHDIITEPTLTPVYPSTEGLHQTPLRKAIQQALCFLEQDHDSLTDYLPESLLQHWNFSSLAESLRQIHAPQPESNSEQTRLQIDHSIKRLAFEELLAHHLRLRYSQRQIQRWQAPIFQYHNALLDDFLRRLPFSPTQAQQRVIQEVVQDCTKPYPMLRLVQGDVGSGKTVIAAFTAFLAQQSGYQIALMAPTEILAEQHFKNFQYWLDPKQEHSIFLTGQLKGKARQETLERIENGQAQIIIGTHALFQDKVQFHNLGLIIIDEQHRFGVDQRLTLREKGRRNQQLPHQLVMTATPIPRTLAMLHYSDLDISVIDELPPGRQPIITRVISSDRRHEIIERIHQRAQAKQQIYWVCTLIEESEALQCEAAENTQTDLIHALPDLNIGLIHGRMKAADKEAIMQAFKQGEYDVLVATTVIEVGVDVPNANLMIIENAERLGLSQLHQLRGRVGRGQHESYCLLMFQAPLSETSRARLAILREHQDGFIIAEKDLLLRGPGDIMGTRQTGQIPLKIADLSRDQDLIEPVQQAAEIILQQHPENVRPIIDRWLKDDRYFSEV